MFNNLVLKFKHNPPRGQNLLFNCYVKRIKQEKSGRWPVYAKTGHCKIWTSSGERTDNSDRLSSETGKTGIIRGVDGKSI